MVPTLVLVALVGGLVALAWVGQRRLVYFPSDVVPATAPTGVEEVVLATSDDLELAAWFVPTRVDPPRSTIVVFHGNGGNRVGRLSLARRLAAAGHDVLLTDYRGYGANPGAPSGAGLALDATAARDWATARGHPVVLLGESLGAGVAIASARQSQPDALVLRSPFSSLAATARHHYPIVPGWFLRDRWPNVDRMADLGDLPVLVVAGGRDRIIPPAQSRAVHEAAANSHLVVIDGAGHNDRALLDGPELVDAVIAFLDAHLARGR